MLKNFFKKIIHAGYSQLVWFCFFFVGVLYFSNLYGAVYLQPDEARAFTLLGTGQFLAIINYPVISIFKSEHSAFYLFAFFGLMNVVLFYYVVKDVFNKNIAFFSFLFFAVFPFNVNYIRSLYPVVFMEFFLILFFLYLYKFHNKKRLTTAFVLGLLAGMLFFVHPVSYFVVLPAVGYFAFLFIQEKTTYESLIKYFLILLTGIIAAVLFVALACHLIDKNFDLWGGLFSVGGMTVHDAKMTDAVFLIKDLVRRCLRSRYEIVKSILTIFFIFSGIVLGIRNKDKYIRFVLFTVLGWLFFYFSLGFLEIVVVQYRHIIWLSLPFALFIGYVVSYNGLTGNVYRRRAVYLCAIILFGIFVFEDICIVRETFRKDVINSFLKENNIRKDRLITMLHLYEDDDAYYVSRVPTYVHRGKRLIAWPYLRKAYNAGLFDYIIPEGLGAYVTVGLKDPMFEGVKPVKTWPHPYKAYKYRHPYTNEDVSFNMYRLSDIFKD
ncbi:MAG: glycosyltransferase family 39 protein [Candidatus Omnitrophica bacterium]|nr:glycosyltransferase family 39 protein [Candidatus Omnitrophota bacterium]MDD5441151.1 glycosyltransferase family 39 protein [Candidatus Omnitrophota bacterium]